MSIPMDCSACSTGEHFRHNPEEGTQPGLIGGTVCECTGDCAGRWAGKAARMQSLFGQDSTEYSGTRGTSIGTSAEGVELHDQHGRTVYLQWSDAVGIADIILTAARMRGLPTKGSDS